MYISAKYYLNWFSFHTFIMKVVGVNFFLKHSVELLQLLGVSSPRPPAQVVPPTIQCRFTPLADHHVQLCHTDK